MTFDFQGKVAFADRMITSYGGPAKLRRGTTDRPCRAAILAWSPREVGLRLEGSRHALISALDPATGAPLSIPPDHEQDLLVLGGSVYRMPLPDQGPRPDGVTVGYHDYEVIYDSREV